MINKLFRSLRYVKNKPVEISVGISPEEAAQDNVGDDKAKLVFTTDRRIFLNGEEIARTKGDERPKPIVNKAIPRFPMKGSRYVVRTRKFDGAYMLNFIVSKKLNKGSTDEINLSKLDAEVVRIFGEENIQKRNLTAIATVGGYTTLTWNPIFRVSDYTKLKDNSIYTFKVLVQYRLSIPRFRKNNFVLRINTGDILSEPDFELEIFNFHNPEHPSEQVIKLPKFENEPCASPDYAIMNGNLFCVAMPKTKEMYEMSDVEGLREVLQYNNVYRFEKFKSYVPYHIIGRQGYEGEHTLYKRAAWVRTKRESKNKFRHKTYRFYGIKKHGNSRDQSIHYVEMYPHRYFIKK